MVPDSIHQLINEKGIEFFLCSFVEISGAPKAKLVPATHVEDMAKDGAGFAGFAAGDINQMPHDPDIMSVPDFSSTTVLPWRKNVAWVAGNMHVLGEAWDSCPRTILRRQLEKVREQGYHFNVGIEPEFMLLKNNGNGYVPYDSLDNMGKPCYDLRTLHRNLDMMIKLIKFMQEMGWEPYANDHEDANCQFEINWTYSDALTTADRHTFFRWMVKTVAEEAGLMATFMPKPFANLTGNGAHYHMSLWDANNETNLFMDESAPNGLSETGRWFMGGVLKHAKALAAITNPIVNSYKRLVVASPRSGATWAPVYITYGASNRTQMIRIPGPGRFEVRSTDGAANSYLSFTAMLAAGMDGIANQIDPGKRNDENLYEIPYATLKKRKIEHLPQNLNEALDHLERDPVIMNALGEPFARYYIDVKRDEWLRYHRSVSQWELENYLGVF